MKESNLKNYLAALLVTVLAFSFPQTIQAQLRPNFIADTTNGCAPLLVKFTDVSTGNPTQWFWDLGNGTTSSAQNPTTFYFNPGSYNVKLIIRNAAGRDSVIKNNFITVNAAPTVNFSANNTSGCYPLKVNFSDLSNPGSGTVTKWEWDFGDGTRSTLQNPQHTYTVAGDFTITFKATNSSGCVSVLSKPAYIKIQGGVQANFGYTSLPTCRPPTLVSFSDSSKGDNLNSYLWTFGDGSTSTQKNPSHTYNASGSYTVKLIIRNAAGCVDSMIKVNEIVIGTVAANFTSPDSVCINSPVNFTNRSIPGPAGATWYFADGSVSNSINTVKSFSTAGNTSVTLVANFGACKDSITKLIYVRPKPVADFTINGSGGSCIPPVTASFKNNSPGAISYRWNFGDGASSTLPDPTHTYTTYGKFNVTLVVTDNKGCTDTLVKTGGVYIGPPEITGISGLPYQGCVPYTSSFSPIIISPEPAASYFWDFGDGTQLNTTVANPNHVYTKEGIYNVTVIVTTTNGCKDTFTLQSAVVINEKPKANFSATPRDACAYTPIQFTDLSTGNVTSYFWMFGDGGTSISKNPSYTYKDTGYFNVTLVIKNQFCEDSVVFTNYVHISPPVANFIAINSCDTQLLVKFLDKSIEATGWKWDFGDGGTSSLQNPTHTYASPGLYYPSLEVTNGTCIHKLTDTVRVVNEIPRFNIVSSSLCKNISTVFTATGIDTANITSYKWNFGDGSSRVTTLPVVTYTYPNAGTFTPVLITTDILGCTDTATKSTPVRISGPNANFTNPEGICVNGTIPFTDATAIDSVFSITRWTWDFGDGSVQTYTSPPFQHLYNKSGSFTVKLTVTDAFGCIDSVVKPNAVLITKPQAMFTVDSVKCSNTEVQFNDQSQGVDLKYLWNFGDGNTSSQANPVHTYVTEGKFVVKLFITDRFGCTDSRVSKALVVANPKAAFVSTDTISSCPPFLITLRSGAKNYSSIKWDFGDGSFSNVDSPSHYYNYAGNYQLKLIAYGFGQCADSISKNIVIKGPSGTLAYDVSKICNPGTINFTAVTKNNASFIWDFSDGNTLATKDSTVSHTYNRPGVYRPRLLLIDAEGCRVPITGVEDIIVADITAAAVMDKRTVCDSGYVSFTDSSVVENDAVSTYLWNFGDGTTSPLKNPVHLYPAPGNYNIQLIVKTTLGCTDTAIISPAIKVIQSPSISITGDSVGCSSQVFTYTGNFLRADTSAVKWRWDFANGNTSLVQNPPPQRFAAPGTYNVTSIATNSSGCADTVIHPVVVNPNPAVDAGKDSIICLGQKMVLQPAGASSYLWTTDPTLNCSACTNPTANPSDTLHKYYVVGANQFNCSATDSVYVRVVQPFSISATPAQNICIGQSVNLFVRGTDNYTWTPATGLSNPAINNPIANPVVTTNYLVVGTDYRGCFKDSATVTVTVYPTPKLNILKDNITIAVGTSTLLETTFSPDVIRWSWSPGQGLSCSDCPQPTASPRNTTTYKAEVYNSAGCKEVDVVTVQVICNNGNFYIPNTFSPNGDGTNDVFYPRGKGIAGIRSFTIFNRWGQVVFQKMNFSANDASAGWNGTYNGKELSADVYVYSAEIICENNEVFPVKGNVTLIK